MQPEREWVGLRPGRRSVRLEFEEVDTPAGPLKVVHNYGVAFCTPHLLPHISRPLC